MQLPCSSVTLGLLDSAVDDDPGSSGKALGLFLGLFFGLLLGPVRGMGSGGMLLEEQGWRSYSDAAMGFSEVRTSVHRPDLHLARPLDKPLMSCRRSARPVLRCGCHRRYRVPQEPRHSSTPPDDLQCGGRQQDRGELLRLGEALSIGRTRKVEDNHMGRTR